MPKLKCVGGPCDGRQADVYEGQERIQLWHRPPPPEFQAQVLVEARPSTSSTWYTVRRFQLTEPGPLCLAPEDWTDTQAVEHLLAK